MAPAVRARLASVRSVLNARVLLLALLAVLTEMVEAPSARESAPSVSVPLAAKRVLKLIVPPREVIGAVSLMRLLLPTWRFALLSRVSVEKFRLIPVVLRMVPFSRNVSVPPVTQVAPV